MSKLVQELIMQPEVNRRLLSIQPLSKAAITKKGQYKKTLNRLHKNMTIAKPYTAEEMSLDKDRFGLAITTVRRYMQALEKSGFVTVEKCAVRGGRQKIYTRVK